MNFNAAHSRSRQSGVTMVELIITMTIAGILLAMGVSSYKYVTKANRASGEINALLGDMQFARHEAVKEGESVQICAVSTATDTACPAIAPTSWSTGGWIVLSNALSGTAGTSSVLRRQLPFSQFGSTDTLTISTAQIVTFTREGMAPALAGYVTFTLHDSLSTASYTRCLVVGLTGVMQTGLATSTYASGGSILAQTCS